MYSNNYKKFIVVMNTRHSIPVLMNALGHITAGLAGRLPVEEANYLAYECPGGSFTSFLSEFPFIVAAAKNTNQLRRLVEEALASDISCNVFVTSMLGSSSEEQVAATRAAIEGGLDYVAVLLFGSTERLEPLTKRFSVFKGPMPVESPTAASRG